MANSPKDLERARKWRAAHPGYSARKTKEWRESHPGRVNRVNKAWRERNPDQVQRLSRAWREAHPERVRGYRRAWEEANPELTRQLKAAWKRANPEKVAIQSALRRARIAGAQIAEITSEQLKAKWAYWSGRCWMCGSNASQWDHVKPVSKGGSHCLANLRPACKPCNQRKGAKWPFVSGAASGT